MVPDVTRLQINLHRQEEREQELMPLVEAPTGIPPHLQRQVFDDVVDPPFGRVAPV